jgi:hypothetical protein
MKILHIGLQSLPLPQTYDNRYCSGLYVSLDLPTGFTKLCKTMIDLSTGRLSDAATTNYLLMKWIAQ